uniref:Uncharacterized protein n=1 Tax=Tetranychus urticae TaxID=32264 RepID=T1KM88_TETUR
MLTSFSLTVSNLNQTQAAPNFIPVGIGLGGKTQSGIVRFVGIYCKTQFIHLLPTVNDVDIVACLSQQLKMATNDHSSAYAIGKA